MIRHYLFSMTSIEKRTFFELETPPCSQIAFGDTIIKEIVFRKYIFSSTKRIKVKLFLKMHSQIKFWNEEIKVLSKKDKSKFNSEH